MKSKLTLLLFVLLVATVGVAGDRSGIEMADVMRSNGKIYVVVAAAGIVLAGILVYLVILDRKVSAMEKKLEKKD